jgi:hypothetical protein
MALAVLLIGFNKPTFLRDRVNELNQSGFSPIYVYLDGIQGSKSAFKSNVLETQRVAQSLFVEKEIDHLHIEQHNYGQGTAIPKAIDWFLSEVGEGLILEDDCQISASLHDFLLKFQAFFNSRPEISAICGSNIYGNHKSELQSATFSRMFESWGWYTSLSKWNRFYSQDMTIPKILDYKKVLSGHSLWRVLLLSWILNRQIARVNSNIQRTWAIRFFYGTLFESAGCIFPSENLILHHFDQSSQHVKSLPDWYGGVELKSSVREQFSPLQAVVDTKFEKYTMINMYGASFPRILRGLIHSLKLVTSNEYKI